MLGSPKRCSCYHSCDGDWFAAKRQLTSTFMAGRSIYALKVGKLQFLDSNRGPIRRPIVLQSFELCYRSHVIVRSSTLLRMYFPITILQGYLANDADF
ncbi:MAG TPA: hypothetical protein DEF45_08545 [Rhodopirellula sp.]|nr:hypothetical protein [Rhodopirellula sp.]